MKTIKTSEDFKLTREYFGLVEDDNDGIKIWGFENDSQDREKAVALDMFIKVL